MFPVVVTTIGVGMVPNGAARRRRCCRWRSVHRRWRRYRRWRQWKATAEGTYGRLRRRNDRVQSEMSVMQRHSWSPCGQWKSGRYCRCGRCRGDRGVCRLCRRCRHGSNWHRRSSGAICPVGVEQVTTVPGIVGSEASGTGASVVSGAPGWVAAENGLGPLSGEVTIVPGVDERPMAVVPMVETCARLALQPQQQGGCLNNKRRIAMASSAPI